MNPQYIQLMQKQSSLSAIVAKLATEGREATAEEKTNLDGLKSDIDSIRAQWETAGRDAFLAGIQKSDKRESLILKSNESFADFFKSDFPSDHAELNIGRYVRGLCTGNWRGADLERKTAMSSIADVSGGYLIPESLSTRVIDLARKRSFAFAAGVGTVPMTTSSLDIAKVTSDPTVTWTAENATITETDMTFGRVSFHANKLAAICRVSLELMEDAQNIDTLIENTLALAMATELDRSILFGNGVGKPLGVYEAAGTLALPSIGTPSNYEDFLEGVYGIRGFNYEPNAVFYSPRTAQTLAKMTTGLTDDETKLVPPVDFANLTKFVTNQVANTYGAGAESVALMGQWDQYLVALRSDIRLEISREAGTAFEKAQVLIRILWRGDGMPVQPAAFAKLTGITA